MADKRNQIHLAEWSDICALCFIVLNDEVKRETRPEGSREEEPIKQATGNNGERLGNKKHEHLPFERLLNINGSYFKWLYCSDFVIDSEGVLIFVSH